MMKSFTNITLILCLLGPVSVNAGEEHKDNATGDEHTFASTKQDSFFEFDDGNKMHYVEQGKGEPVLFIHGAPTSSFLWRKVTPLVASQVRTIAIDLMGFGQSDAIVDGYRVEIQAQRLSDFVNGLGLDTFRMVLHDWGGPVGFAYAAANPERVSAVAFFETAFAPFPSEDLLPTGVRLARDPVMGRKIVIDENWFIETALANNQFNGKMIFPIEERLTLRLLTNDVMQIYRQPFIDPERRELLWLFPQELAFLDEPGPKLDLWLGFADYMATATIPKLAIFGNPGFGLKANAVFPDPDTGKPMVDPSNGFLLTVENIVLGKVSPEYGGWLAAGEVVQMRSPSAHFFQEDAPEELGKILADWLENIM